MFVYVFDYLFSLFHCLPFPVCARKALCRGKEKAQESLVNKLNNSDGRWEIFQIARQISNGNKDIVGEQCIRNDHGKVIVMTLILGTLGDSIKVPY